MSTQRRKSLAALASLRKAEVQMREVAGRCHDAGRRQRLRTLIERLAAVEAEWYETEVRERWGLP